MNSRPNDPNNPLVKAFFLGRAVAELVSENIEKAATEVLSEIGKFDAEQRVNVRNFVEQVNVRADQAMAQTATTPEATTPGAAPSHNGDTDLQATIDDLRAEIASARTELQRYRSGLN
ncbi:hypothetical protein IQ266_23045 [filamentous cyanobacterium LEGE 11480]|uniref:Thylakoid lumen protein n=1 Tax=Romeriopsis navalis LEGE 11480 TaxID=2777977 RepID=A0A928VV49_9CYAN|nr:hypothetical protein [Romeriopsis navalis]MBE9032619.1 hypothetical protein [Romeriopsis navalis LEGE 11480]